MILKDRLSRGVSKKSCVIKLYTARIQRRMKKIEYIRFFAWLIAWCSFFANLILMCMYVVNPKISSAVMMELSIGFMIIAFLCALVARIASLED